MATRNSVKKAHSQVASDSVVTADTADLLQLLTIDCLPLSRTKTRELKKGLEHPEALDRLVRRFELATAISRARDAGLHEVAEHQASNVLTAK